MRLKKGRVWTWLINEKSMVEKEDISGKYLLFSKDNRKLFKIAKKILKKFNLPLARITKEKARSILFVYDKKPRFSESIGKFLFKKPEIDFKNWSNEIKKEKINEVLI